MLPVSQASLRLVFPGGEIRLDWLSPFRSPLSMKLLPADPVIPFGGIGWMTVREYRCHLIYCQLMFIWRRFHQMEIGFSIITTINTLSISEICAPAALNSIYPVRLSFTMSEVGTQIMSILSTAPHQGV